MLGIEPVPIGEVAVYCWGVVATENAYAFRKWASRTR